MLSVALNIVYAHGGANGRYVLSIELLGVLITTINQADYGPFALGNALERIGPGFEVEYDRLNLGREKGSIGDGDQVECTWQYCIRYHQVRRSGIVPRNDLGVVGVLISHGNGSSSEGHHGPRISKTRRDVGPMAVKFNDRPRFRSARDRGRIHDYTGRSAIFEGWLR